MLEIKASVGIKSIRHKKISIHDKAVERETWIFETKLNAISWTNTSVSFKLPDVFDYLENKIRF